MNHLDVNGGRTGEARHDSRGGEARLSADAERSSAGPPSGIPHEFARRVRRGGSPGTGLPSSPELKSKTRILFAAGG
jgi:hypothetical protein